MEKRKKLGKSLAMAGVPLISIADRRAVQRLNLFILGKSSIALIIEKRKSLSERERQRLRRFIQRQAQ